MSGALQVTFMNQRSFAPPGVLVNFLVIAGGGSGGRTTQNCAGGGGGGG